jgi:hypothetical protein
MAYTAIDRFNDEVAAVHAAMVNYQMTGTGGIPYNSYEGALDYLYKNYGVPAGISFQQAQSAVSNAFGIAGAGVLGAEDGGTTPTPPPGPTTPQGRTTEEIAALNAKHKENLRQIEQAFQSGLLDYSEKVAALEDARNNLIGQKNQGMESNSAYFSNVSPDAFQSQMGNYNQKVLDAYTQGEKTLENNQKSIDYSKQVNDQNLQAQLAGENTFNAGTGDYSGAFKFSAPTIQAPTINAVTQNPYEQAAKLGVPSWAPNYGGLSTMQKKKEEDSIQKYLG